MKYFLKTENGCLKSQTKHPLTFCCLLLHGPFCMYLLFGNSFSKLLDNKYITLNSPLTSRMSPAKQNNTCLVIL